MTRLWRPFIGPLAALGALLALAGGVFAQAPPPTGLMAEGERAVRAGGVRRGRASSTRPSSSQGYQDAALYYNLGNAYLEGGDLGRAVLSYLAGGGTIPPRPGRCSKPGTRPQAGPWTKLRRRETPSSPT